MSKKGVWTPLEHGGWVMMKGNGNGKQEREQERRIGSGWSLCLSLLESLYNALYNGSVYNMKETFFFFFFL